MFKVGMGETPEIPSNISEEGHNFILKCIQHNPKQRATTLQLRQHTFLKVIVSLCGKFIISLDKKKKMV